MVIKDAGRSARVWALITAHADGSVTVGHVCGAAVVAVGVDGAALSLAPRPDHQVLQHATDEVAGRMDDLRLTLGEGPCVEAWRERGPVLVPDLASVDAMARWPWFAAAAVEAGAAALFSFPLQTGAIRLGTLELYRRKPGPLTTDQLADALTFADAALQITLATVHPAADGLHIGWPADGRGTDHAEVYQATGMVAVQLGTGLDEAFVRLRAHAFAQGVDVAETARQIVDRSLRLETGG